MSAHYEGREFPLRPLRGELEIVSALQAKLGANLSSWRRVSGSTDELNRLLMTAQLAGRKVKINYRTDFPGPSVRGLGAERRRTKAPVATKAEEAVKWCYMTRSGRPGPVLTRARPFDAGPWQSLGGRVPPSPGVWPGHGVQCASGGASGCSLACLLPEKPAEMCSDMALVGSEVPGAASLVTRRLAPGSSADLMATGPRPVASLFWFPSMPATAADCDFAWRARWFISDPVLSRP